MFSLTSEILNKVLYVVVAVLVLCVVALGVGYYYRGAEIEEKEAEVVKARTEAALTEANYNLIHGALDRQSEAIESLRADMQKRTTQHNSAVAKLSKTYEEKRRDDRGRNETECDGMKRIIVEEWGVK